MRSLSWTALTWAQEAHGVMSPLPIVPARWPWKNPRSQAGSRCGLHGAAVGATEGTGLLPGRTGAAGAGGTGAGTGRTGATDAGSTGAGAGSRGASTGGEQVLAWGGQELSLKGTGASARGAGAGAGGTGH